MMKLIHHQRITWLQNMLLLFLCLGLASALWAQRASTASSNPINNLRWSLVSAGTIQGLNGVHYELSAINPTAEAANLDQLRNGGIGEPPTPNNWVNGNAGPENAHFIEGWSIPYRMVITGLTPGSTSNTLVIEWDIMGSSGTKHALDYITHFQNLGSNTLHNQLFGHNAETVNPNFGYNLSPTNTFTIPTPYASSTSGDQFIAKQSFLSLDKKNFTIYGGAISAMAYVSEGTFTDGAKTRMSITFSAVGSTVVMGWGGHIAMQTDWGVGESASDINGSPYHTRLISLNGSGGNQDRSLKAAAVVVPPECSITPVADVCAGSTASLVFDGELSNVSSSNTTYTWSLNAGTTGATLSGTVSGTINNLVTDVPDITVVPPSGGFTAGTMIVRLDVSRTFSGVTFSSYCTETVVVNPPPTCSITGADQVCPKSTGNSYSGPAGMATYSWSISGDGTIPGATNGQTVSVTAGSTCGGSFTLTLTVTDGNGCSSTCTKTVNIVDNTPPVLSGCPTPTVSVQCYADVPAAATVTALDNCKGAITPVFSQTESNPGSSCNNVITRTWTATDDCGNTASCSQTITVNDITPPTITCAAAKNVDCGATLNFDEPTVSDNCDQNVTVTHTDATVGNVTTRTWTATDDCGNYASCSQSLTVLTCAHIFPTETKCCNYLYGNTSSFQLQNVCITVQNGIITNAVPGVFFYYGDYTPTANGQVNISVIQTTGGYHPFDVQGTNQAWVYVDGCTNATFTTNISGPNASVSFYGLAGHKYVIAVKYATKSIQGYSIPNNTSYKFGMYLNGTTLISGSEGTLTILSQGCSVPSFTLDGCTQSITAADLAPDQPVADLTVTAVPNPYNDNVRFTFASPVTGQGTLEVFNMLGQKIQTVFEGQVQAGRAQQVEFRVPEANRENLIYIMRVGNYKATGKLINRR